MNDNANRQSIMRSTVATAPNKTINNLLFNGGNIGGRELRRPNFTTHETTTIDKVGTWRLARAIAALEKTYDQINYENDRVREAVEQMSLDVDKIKYMKECVCDPDSTVHINTLVSKVELADALQNYPTNDAYLQTLVDTLKDYTTLNDMRDSVVTMTQSKVNFEILQSKVDEINIRNMGLRIKNAESLNDFQLSFRYIDDTDDKVVHRIDVYKNSNKYTALLDNLVEGQIVINTNAVNKITYDDKHVMTSTPDPTSAGSIDISFVNSLTDIFMPSTNIKVYDISPFDKQLSNHNSRINSLESYDKSLNDRITPNTTFVEAFKKGYTTNISDGSLTISEITDLRSDVDTHSESINTINDNISGLSAQATAIIKKTKENTTAIANTNTELAKVRKEFVDSTTSILNKHNNEIKLATEQVDINKEDIIKLVAKDKSLDSDISELDQRITSNLTKINTNAQNIETNRLELIAHDLRITTNDNNISKLDNKIDNVKIDFDDSLTRLSEKLDDNASRTTTLEMSQANNQRQFNKLIANDKDFVIKNGLQDGEIDNCKYRLSIIEAPTWAPIHERLCISKDLNVGTDTNINGTTNAKTINATVINTSSNVNIGDNLLVKSNTAIKGQVNIGEELKPTQLHIDGNEILHGDLTVGSNTKAVNFKLFGDEQVSKSLQVGGKTILNDSLTVKEETVLNDALTVNAMAKINETLTVEKQTNIKADTFINGNTKIGTDTLASTLNVIGNTTIGDSTRDSSLTVMGNETLYGNLTVGTTSNNKQLIHNGNAIIGDINQVSTPNTLDINANTTIGTVNRHKTLTVNGDTNIGEQSSNNKTILKVYSDSTIGTTEKNRSLVVNGNTTIGDDNKVNINSNKLQVYSDSTFGTAIHNRSVEILGNVKLGDESKVATHNTLNIYSDSTIGTVANNKSLNVLGNVSLGDELKTNTNANTLDIHSNTTIGTVANNKTFETLGNVKLGDETKVATHNTLHVFSDSTIGTVANNKSLNVLGNVSLGDELKTNTNANTLDIHSNSTIGTVANNKSLNVLGNVSLGDESKVATHNTLSVYSDSTIGTTTNNKSLNVLGNVSLGDDTRTNTLQVVSDSTFGTTTKNRSLTVNGNVKLGDESKVATHNTLQVFSDSTIGTTNNNKSLNVLGNVSLGDELKTNTNANTLDIHSNTTIGTVANNKSLTIVGSQTISDTLTTKNANVTDKLISGTSTATTPSLTQIYGTTNIGSNDSAVTTTSTLNVYGNTTIGTVTNNKTFETLGNVKIGDESKVATHNTLSVYSDSTIGTTNNNKSLNVLGNVSLGDESKVATHNTLSVYSDSTIGTTNNNKSLNVLGNVSLGDELKTNTNANTLDIHSNSTIGTTNNNKSLNVLGNVSLGDDTKTETHNTLQVFSDSTIGTTTNNKSLTVLGNVSLGDDTKTETHNTLQVFSDSTIGTTTNNKSLTVLGNATIGDDTASEPTTLTVPSNITLGTNTNNKSTTLSILSDTTIGTTDKNKDITINGSGQISNKLNIGDPLTLPQLSTLSLNAGHELDPDAEDDNLSIIMSDLTTASNIIHSIDANSLPNLDIFVSADDQNTSAHIKEYINRILLKAPTVQVDGNQTVKGTLTSIGKSSFTNAIVNGTLDLTNATVIGGVFTGAGPTNEFKENTCTMAHIVGSNMNVSGKLTIGGLTTLYSNLLVNGESNLNNNLTVFGNEHVVGSLTVDGAMNIKHPVFNDTVTFNNNNSTDRNVTGIAVRSALSTIPNDKPCDSRSVMLNIGRDDTNSLDIGYVTSNRGYLKIRSDNENSIEFSDKEVCLIKPVGMYEGFDARGSSQVDNLTVTGNLKIYGQTISETNIEQIGDQHITGSLVVDKSLTANSLTVRNSLQTNSLTTNSLQTTSITVGNSTIAYNPTLSLTSLNNAITFDNNNINLLKRTNVSSLYTSNSLTASNPYRTLTLLDNSGNTYVNGKLNTYGGIKIVGNLDISEAIIVGGNLAQYSSAGTKYSDFTVNGNFVTDGTSTFKNKVKIINESSDNIIKCFESIAPSLLTNQTIEHVIGKSTTDSIYVGYQYPHKGSIGFDNDRDVITFDNSKVLINKPLQVNGPITFTNDVINEISVPTSLPTTGQRFTITKPLSLTTSTELPDKNIIGLVIGKNDESIYFGYQQPSKGVIGFTSDFDNVEATGQIMSFEKDIVNIYQKTDMYQALRVNGSAIFNNTINVNTYSNELYMYLAKLYAPNINNNNMVAMTCGHSPSKGSYFGYRCFQDSNVITGYGTLGMQGDTEGDVVIFDKSSFDIYRRTSVYNNLSIETNNFKTAAISVNLDTTERPDLTNITAGSFMSSTLRNNDSLSLLFGKAKSKLHDYCADISYKHPGLVSLGLNVTKDIITYSPTEINFNKPVKFNSDVVFSGELIKEIDRQVENDLTIDGITFCKTKYIVGNDINTGSYYSNGVIGLNKNNIIEFSDELVNLNRKAVVNESVQVGSLIIKNNGLTLNNNPNYLTLTTDNLKIDKRTLINANLNVTGDIEISGDLIVKHKLLTVFQDQQIKGNVDIDKKLCVDGNATFWGVTTIKNILDVTGETTFSNTVNTQNTLNINGQTNVNGLTQFNNDVTIGTSTVNKSLTIFGTQTNNGTVNINGTMNITNSSTINSNGNFIQNGPFKATNTSNFVSLNVGDKSTSADGNLNSYGYNVIEKDVSLLGNVIVGSSNKSTINQLTVQTPLVSKNISVDGELNVNDKVIIGKTISNFNNSVIIGSANDNKPLTINGNEFINGNLTIKDTLSTTSSDITISKPTNIQNSLKVNQDGVICEQPLSVNNNLIVKDTLTTTASNMTITKPVDVNNNLNVNDVLKVNTNEVIINKPTKVNNNLNVNDNSFEVNSQSTFKNNSTFEKNVSVNGSMQINNDTTFTKNVTINGNETVTGSTSLNTLTVANSTTLADTTIGSSSTNKSLTINGNESVTGNTSLNTLTVTNSTTLNDTTIGSSSNDKTLTHYGPEYIYGNVNIGTSLSKKQLTVNGNELIDGQLTVNNSSYLNGTVTIGSSTDPKQLTHFGNEITTGDITVNGNEQINGNVTIGTSSANKTLTVNGNEQITGNVTIGTSSVNKQLIINGDSRVSKTLTIDGNTFFNDSAVIGSSANPKSLTIYGNETVVGNLYLGSESSTINTTGQFNHNGDLNIGTASTTKSLKINNKPVSTVEYVDTLIASYRQLSNNTFNDNVIVGSSSANKTLTVNGSTNMNNDATINKSLTVYGASMFNNNVIVGTSAANKTLTVNGNESITGDATINKSLTVGTDLTVTNKLNVKDVNITGTAKLNTKNIATEDYIDSQFANYRLLNDNTYNSNILIGNADTSYSLLLNGQEVATQQFVNNKNNFTELIAGNTATKDGTVTVNGILDLTNATVIGGGFVKDQTPEQLPSDTGAGVGMINTTTDNLTITNSLVSDGVALFRNTVAIGSSATPKSLTVNGRNVLTEIDDIKSTQKSQTITHYCPFVGDCQLGHPVFMTGSVYKFVKNNWVKSTVSDWEDCICEVKNNGTWKEFVGVVTSIDMSTKSLKFATHGDYLFFVQDSSSYNIGDVLLYDGSILDENESITTRIKQSIIGKVTSIVNKNIISIFKD